MTLPRDLSGAELARALQRLGHAAKGLPRPPHHHTFRRASPHDSPAHPAQGGKLSSVLREVGTHHGMTRDELLTALLD